MRKSIEVSTSTQVDWGFQASNLATAAKQAIRDLLYDDGRRGANPYVGEIQLSVTLIPGEGRWERVTVTDEQGECDCGRKETAHETGEGRLEEEEIVQEKGSQEAADAVPAHAEGVLTPLSPKKAAAKPKPKAKAATKKRVAHGEG